VPAWLERTWYGGGALAWLLWPLSMMFRGVAGLRRTAYRHGWLRVRPSARPVIVVGNLSVGGTGKTPLVLWLLERLAERGIAAGVVSRGYGGREHTVPRRVTAADSAADVGDEPLLIARRSGVPVVVCRDRAAAVDDIVHAGVQLVLSDDGLQHYAMARAAELVVVDGDRGLGNGLCLPAGPLREPPSRLAEVAAVLVNGGSAMPAGLPATVLRMALVPRELRGFSPPHRQPLAWLSGRRVHAVAGIGHPGRFFALLERLGAQVIPHPMPDHAPLGAAALHFADGLPVVMTEKDAVRCTGEGLTNHWWLTVDAELPPEAGEYLVGVLLATALPSAESLHE
jgi:tetraacyldisaccharide 4'-kinase